MLLPFEEEMWVTDHVRFREGALPPTGTCQRLLLNAPALSAAAWKRKSKGEGGQPAERAFGCTDGWSASGASPSGAAVREEERKTKQRVCWRNRKWSRPSLSHHCSNFCPPPQAGTTTAGGNIPLVLYDVWKSRGITG